MAKLPAMQNQYVEFAKNDSNGKKIDIEAINTAIEAVKNGSAQVFYTENDFTDLAQEELTELSTNKYALLKNESEGYAYLIYAYDNNISFFTISDTVEDFAYVEVYNAVIPFGEENWELSNKQLTIGKPSGTKLYRHEITVLAYNGSFKFVVISTLSSSYQGLGDLFVDVLYGRNMAEVYDINTGFKKVLIPRLGGTSIPLIANSANIPPLGDYFDYQPGPGVQRVAYTVIDSTTGLPTTTYQSITSITSFTSDTVTPL